MRVAAGQPERRGVVVQPVPYHPQQSDYGRTPPPLTHPIVKCAPIIAVAKRS